VVRARDGKRTIGEGKGAEGKGKGIWVRFGEGNGQEQWKGLEMKR